MGNKIITEKDFWMCTGGNVPAQLQSTQLSTKKKDGKKYITLVDTATSSMMDFGCNKLMLIMAIVAAVIAVCVVATGGAALIAIGALAGAAGAAVGAVMGGLICGQIAAMARIWTASKSNMIVQGKPAITGDHQLQCMLFGDEITFAPNIKNWWQAIALGGANYIGGIMEGMLAGAAVGMGGAMITGARTAFLQGGTRAVGQASLNLLKSIPANVLQNIGATFGYAGGFSTTSVAVAGGLRGLTAAQAGLDHYGKTGESGWSEAGKGVFGMEEGMAHSVSNIATGNATWQDIAGVALLGSPAHEAVKEEPKTKGKEAPKTEEPIKNTTLAEPEPVKKKADGEAFEMGDIITLRKQQAIEFYQKYNPDMDINDIKSHINGIDFTKPIEIVKTPQGTELHQYTKVNTKGDVLKGDYYTDNPENTPSELGVSDKYNVRDPDNGWKQTDEIKTVQQEKVAIPKDAEGLKSTSASIEDTWSLKNQSVPTKGGGSQIYIPKKQF